MEVRLCSVLQPTRLNSVDARFNFSQWLHAAGEIDFTSSDRTADRSEMLVAFRSAVRDSATSRLRTRTFIGSVRGWSNWNAATHSAGLNRMSPMKLWRSMRVICRGQVHFSQI
jgi:hypothetical protein